MRQVERILFPSTREATMRTLPEMPKRFIYRLCLSGHAMSIKFLYRSVVYCFQFRNEIFSPKSNRNRFSPFSLCGFPLLPGGYKKHISHVTYQNFLSNRTTI